MWSRRISAWVPSGSGSMVLELRTGAKPRWSLSLGIVLAMLMLIVSTPANARASAAAQSAPPQPEALSGTLTLASVEQLAGPQQGLYAQAARRANPDAVAARGRSREAFRGLDATDAERLAREAFPEVLAVDSGTPPLARGRRITRYLNEHAASVDLGDGRQGVIESNVPIAAPGAHGRAAALDLGLHGVNGGFAPTTAASPLLLHTHAADGATLTDSGLSIAPVSSRAAVRGALDGGAMLYANTQTDADTLLKPVADGVAVDGVLRSPASPQRLAFTVSGGGRVRLSKTRSGAVRVSLDGDLVAVVQTPSAKDAAGTEVPVTMHVSGERLVLEVAHHDGDYEYPIEVDPTVTDTQLLYLSEGSNWHHGTSTKTDSPFFLTQWAGDLQIEGLGFTVGQWGVWAYETQGVSKIYSFGAETSSSDPGSDLENRVLIIGHGGVEAQAVLPSSYGLTWTSVSAAGTANNAAEFGEWATKAGSGSVSVGKFHRAEVLISQEAAPTVAADKTDPTFEGQTNVAYTGGWLRAEGNRFAVTAQDPGLGVSEMKFRSPQAPSFEVNISYLFPMEECHGVQCLPTETEGVTGNWGGTTKLPEGKDTLEVTALNATHASTTASMEVKVDRSQPHDLSVTGLPENAELGDGTYKLHASASDGTGTTPSSGLAPLTISVDGTAVGTPQGGCSAGPCSTSGDWTVSGSQFAVGQHVLTLTATDIAGNTITKDTTIFVSRPVSPVEVGPGEVNPESGELRLQAADVSIGAPGGSLTVERSYGSEHLSAGAQGPLGPSWVFELGSSGQSITKLPTGSVLLSSDNGLQSVFTPSGGGAYTAPKGDENLKLVESTVAGKVQFQLSSSGGSATTFTLPAGGTGNTWVPTSEAGPNNTGVTTFAYQTVGSIIEPTEELAPVPANVSCTTLVRGCRALKFVYASSTTATGDAQSAWGDYKGRLKQVTFTAWDPSSSAMSTTAVAQYSYDQLGRLRAEWDPRVAPALKTTFGYDAYERVTSVTPSGEQPWLLAYGTGAGDVRTGHLVSVTRPTLSAAEGPGITPQNTTAPALSNTNAAEGKTITVTTGAWSNTPLAYSYQWEECQTVSGAEVCTPLPGETNSSYVSVYHGPNRWVKALVTATNANGATTVATASTEVVLANSYMEKTSEFGSSGSGNGQLFGAGAIATDATGNVWVADSGNNRVEKFSSTGAFLAAYGTLGSGAGQFKTPEGIAIDSAGKVWVADYGNSRVEVLSSAGAYLGAFTTPVAPQALAVYPFGSENVLYVGEGTSIVAYHGTAPNLMSITSTFGGSGTGNGKFTSSVGGLAVDELSSKLYASDLGGHRVEVFTNGFTPTYLSQFGSAGTGDGHFGSPHGLALQAGNVFVADTPNANVQKFIGSASLGEYAEAVGVFGVATYPRVSNGSLYVLNRVTAKVAKWTTATRPAPPPPTPPNPGSSSVWTLEYSVPVSGASAPAAMQGTEVAKWGQTDVPVEAMAILPPDSPQGWPASSYVRATVYYLDSDGHTVNVLSPGGLISTTEYNADNDVVRTLTPGNRSKALAEGSKALEVSHLLDTQSTYSEDGSELLSTMGPQHTVKLASGSQVLARHKTRYFYDEGAPATGGPYHLVTKLTEAALLTSAAEEDVHTTVNSYAGQEGLGWKLRAPTSITTDPSGLKVVRTKLYDAQTGYVTDAINPGGNPAGGDAHDSQAIYYTALANAKVAACGLHPEWANLPCQTKLAKAPETAGVPNPPVTTTTYNLWDQAVETTSVVGADSRKLVETYDGAGRPKTAAVTATAGTSLPTVTFGYDSVSGKLSTSSTTEGSTTRTLTSVFNKWGKLAEYTDADGVSSKYTYDVDGRSSTADDGKGSTTYNYDSTTGAGISMADSTGTFSATYDKEGRIATEVFPNGMTEKYAYNETGQLTGLEYVKTSNCSSNCTWYSDSVVPSITGQWLTQASTLSSQGYKYDTAGRLTQVQDTPAGQGCTTRLYGYDADGNRTSQTTRNPGTGGVCATEGGTTVGHSYDAADRLTDTGATYDAFGNITSTPAGDAGGTTLSSSFFVNGTLAGQTQNGQVNTFHLDPAGREREMVASGTKALTSVMHYAGGGSAPSWTAEGTTGWTRNVNGLGGSLVATQTNGESPVLQVTNLHGDVVATASISATATALASTNDTTEFGVPRTATPPKYSWLGGAERATTLASGVIAMGARTYVPQIGRFLQTDPQAGGSANAYAYSSDDPVNNSDPSGEATGGLSDWLYGQNEQIGQEVIAREAAREAAARAAAEAAAAAAAEAAAAAPGEYDPGPIYVDPTHSKDLTPHQAIALALAIKAGGQAAQELLAHYFGSLIGHLAEITAAVLNKAADYLEICGSALEYNSRNRCRVEIHTQGIWTPFGTIDTYVPFGDITIRPCIYFKKADRFGHKRGLNCQSG